jgi:hypothetical protein
MQIDSNFDFNRNRPRGEAFLADEADLALIIVIYDPETEEERQLAVPFSLLPKLWPELIETVGRLEELLRRGI